MGVFRIHRRLTKEHIYLTSESKMRNHLANEVLNTDMLYLMKEYQKTVPNPDSLLSTITLLKETSDLVTIVTDTHPISTTTDNRLQKLLQIGQFFQTWESQIQESTLYSQNKHLITRETREDINCCINGFMSLCKLHVHSGHTITPGYVNSDIIENLFCQQRGTRNGNKHQPDTFAVRPSKQRHHSRAEYCIQEGKCQEGRNILRQKTKTGH